MIETERSPEAGETGAVGPRPGREAEPCGP